MLRRFEGRELLQLKPLQVLGHLVVLQTTLSYILDNYSSAVFTDLLSGDPTIQKLHSIRGPTGRVDVVDLPLVPSQLLAQPLTLTSQRSSRQLETAFFS
jgi:hypothetical protein